MADFNSKYTGEQVEEFLDQIANGEIGGGGGGEVQKTTEAEITAMGFTKNLGTITEVKMNDASKGSSGVVDLGNVVTSVKINGTTKNPSSGVVDLGTVITSHQSLSNYYTKSEVDSKIASSITNAINASY